jgi:hypothetical protein
MIAQTLEEKIAAINAKAKSKNEEASRLLDYLSVQREKAKATEEEEEERLKKKGIIIGQHIPSLRSQLDLDQGTLAEFENFSSTLLVAKTLVDQNKTNFLRRTGNLPISELAEARKAQNEKRRADVVPDMPNYLLKTSSALVREERVGERFVETITSMALEKTQRREREMSASEGQKKAPKRKKDILSAPERLANEAVLQSINHKLNYLRNPRNDPAGVTRMLVKPRSHFEGGSVVGGGSVAVAGEDSTLVTRVDHQSAVKSIHSASVEAKSAKSHDTEGSAKSKKSYGKPEKVTNNPLFVPEPSTLFFTNYDVGKKYTQSISFRNVSAVTRSIRVLPPTNPAFTISPLRFPTNSSGGMIAPGMNVTATITFVPTTLGDFVDEVHVDTESGSFDVHVRAQREPPQLSIPSVLDVGCCLVGDAQRLSFNCLNSGGGGRFRLLTAQEHRSLGLDTASVEETASSVLGSFLEPFTPNGPGSCLRIAPFTLYPTEFELMKGESVEVTIEFVPLELRGYQERFYMTCDNGQVRTFTLRGASRGLDLAVSEVNCVEFDSSDPKVFPDLYFPPACVGCEQVQQIQVVNDTGLPVEYEWIWVDMRCTDLHAQGQRQIYDRERIEEARQAQMLENDLNGVEHLPAAVVEGGAARGHSAAAKRDLLKSLHVSLEGAGERGTTADAVSNRAVGGPSDVFEVSPARGVLPGEGAEKFDFRFNPADLALSGMRAVMMVKHAPLAALPGPTQMDCLARLRNAGHGPFPRACSWLEEMGTAASVDEYVKLSGAISTSKNLVNLQTLVHLVVSQVMNDESCGVEDYEFRRMSKWVRELLKHADAARSAGNVVIMDDNSSVDNDTASVASSVAAASIDGVTLYLESYDWDTATEDGGDAEQAAGPMPLQPLRVSRIVDPVPELLSDSGNEMVLDDEIPAIPTLREFHPQERAMLGEVWLDVPNAVTLMGDAVSAVLDAKVKHEAVDYLKECALNNLAALQVAVYGEGQSQAIHVTPPVLEFGGLLSIGKSVTGTFTLTNRSLTTAEIELDLSHLRVETLFSSAAHEAYEETLTQANILSQSELVTFVPEYERVLVMPQSEVVVHFNLTIYNTGRYRVYLPLLPKSPYTTVDSLSIFAHVGGVRLRFNTAEVDIGLVGVGSEGSKVITFTNEGDVPAMFMMKPQLHVDMNAGGKKENAGGSVGEEDNRSLGSQRNVSGKNTQRDSLSRMSSARSDDFSVGGESNATSTDFKIELKNAVVTIEPPSGIVLPQSTFSVNVVCKAGKIPQRIRGLLESRVFDVTGKIEILSHYLNLRGEVQAPKTKMYPLTTNLGQVYVGMPVQFTVSIENMCNLPTMYKLSRPGGDSSLYKLTYDKPKGPLEAKQKIDILCTFTSVATGMIDDIISNKVFGAAVPLAFVVKALSKGIQLEFRNLPDGVSPPPPLAAPTATQFPNNEKPPEPQPIKPLELGGDVPLYQRRTVRFVIRNFSAIPATFQLSPKKFKVVEKAKRWPSSNESAVSAVSASTVERSDLVLAPHETGTDRFQSDAGKEYIGFTVQKQEDRKFLHSGLGASYLLDVTEGVLPPWGVQLVTIRAFNDIPGCYDDEIECIVTEGTVTHTYAVPITMSVVGCPVVIEKDTLGMTVVHKGDPAHIGKQMLQLGYACVNSEPLVREFYVKNHGSKNGKVKWQVESLTSKTNGPVKFSLRIDEHKRVHPVFQFWENIAKDSPFKIEPASATIPPYGKQLFKITLFRTHSVGKELALLTGSVLFSDNIPPSAANSVAGDDDISVGSGMALPIQPSASTTMSRAPSRAMTANASKATLPAGSNRFTLSLILEGVFQHPAIMIDRNVLEAPAAPTMAPDVFALNLKAAATTLFAKGAKAAEFCHRSITISNPCDARLLFNVSTEGPFVIKDGAGTVAVAGSVVNGGASVAHSAAPSVSVAKSTVGKTFNLLPNVSIFRTLASGFTYQFILSHLLFYLVRRNLDLSTSHSTPRRTCARSCWAHSRTRLGTQLSNTAS